MSPLIKDHAPYGTGNLHENICGPGSKLFPYNFRGKDTYPHNHNLKNNLNSDS